MRRKRARASFVQCNSLPLGRKLRPSTVLNTSVSSAPLFYHFQLPLFIPHPVDTHNILNSLTIKTFSRMTQVTPWPSVFLVQGPTFLEHQPSLLILYRNVYCCCCCLFVPVGLWLFESYICRICSGRRITCIYGTYYVCVLKHRRLKPGTQARSAIYHWSTSLALFLVLF